MENYLEPNVLGLGFFENVIGSTTLGVSSIFVGMSGSNV